ncbi:MAG: ribosome silencing factor [Pseudomonadales bacterium]|nr:ribosome silencing factor [Pseudomonadales bacterium]
MSTKPDKKLSLIINTLENIKARDIITLDIRPHNSIADTLVIASGTSNRHIKSMAEHVVEKLKQSGEQPLPPEGGESSDWVLVDLSDIIVHLMMPEARARYDLEHLWSPPEVKSDE